MLLLWGLSRRRERQAELDRETVVPTGLEDEPTAPASTPDADLQAVRQVEDALREFPEVDMVSAEVGTFEGRNSSHVNVRFKDRSTGRASQKEKSPCRGRRGGSAGTGSGIGDEQ